MNRNGPQLIIQAIYVLNQGTIDSLVATTMLFSAMSVVICVFYMISRKMGNNNINRGKSTTTSLGRLNSMSHDDDSNDVVTTTTYKVEIKCDKFKTYHKYTHKLIGHCICSALGIDDIGNIEVFYVISAHKAIVCYVQVSNLNGTDSYNGEKSIFSIGQKNSNTNQAFIQEMMDKLEFSTEGTSNNMEVNVEYHTLGMLSVADLNDKRLEMDEKNKGAHVPVHIVA